MMDTILFDLDGTLLPMDQDAFVKVYFTEISKKCAKYGFEPQQVTRAIWSGTKAMVGNDGSRTNEKVFWEYFAEALGQEVLELKPVLEKFYSEEFHLVRTCTQANQRAADVIAALKAKGYTVILASNPVFPKVAYRSRASWIDVDLEDFLFVTPYEEFHYCKPSLGYYQEILARAGKEPQQCMMVGNDVQEDGCASRLGMACYLVTDNLINEENEDFSHFPHGSFEDFYHYAQNLPSLV